MKMKTEHLVLLSQLAFEHLEAVLETLYDLALRVEDIRKKDPSIVSMRTFVNWGPNAGGSKQHPHLQNLLTEEFSPTAVSREIEVCDRYLENTGTNMFEAYIDSTRKNGSRVVYDGDDIFICTPFAPRYEDETLVIPKRPIAHILQTTEADRKKLVRPSLGVFGANFYYFVRGDVNIGIRMAPFGSPAGLYQAAESYRMHFHIIPRRNPASSHGVAREGGSEIMFEDYAVGKFPEDSAAGFREWYRPGGPNPDLVPSALRDQFERHVLGHQPVEIF